MEPLDPIWVRAAACDNDAEGSPGLRLVDDLAYVTSAIEDR
jgi:hypothetical protein